MLAKDFVSDLIPAVTVMESANQVVRRMCEFKVSHLPVLEGADYLGLISEKDIRNLADQNQLIGANSVRFSETSVMESQHIYEVIDTISRHDLTVLPVLTSGKKYLGCITLPALVKAFSLLCAAGQPGAILVLSLGLSVE